jgi:hypothetical protein
MYTPNKSSKMEKEKIKKSIHQLSIAKVYDGKSVDQAAIYVGLSCPECNSIFLDICTYIWTFYVCTHVSGKRKHFLSHVKKMFFFPKNL